MNTTGKGPIFRSLPSRMGNYTINKKEQNLIQSVLVTNPIKRNKPGKRD